MRRLALFGLVAAALTFSAAAFLPATEPPRPQDARPGEIPLGEWSGEGHFVYESWSLDQPAPDGGEQPAEAGGLAQEDGEPMPTDEGPEEGEPAPDEEPETREAPNLLALLGILGPQDAQDEPAAEADQTQNGNAKRVKGESIQRRYRTSLSIKPHDLAGREVTLIEIRSHRGELPGLEERTHLLVALVEGKRISKSTVLCQAVAFAINPKPRDELVEDKSGPPFAATCTTEGDVTTLQINYMDNFTDTFRFEDGRLEKHGSYYDRQGGLIHWAERLRQH